MEELKISNELLSDILDRKTEFIEVNEENDTISYHFWKGENKYWNQYCIYQFINQCKEWAFEKGFPISTCRSSRG